MWHSQDWYILGLVSTFWPEPRGAGLQEASQFMSVFLSVCLSTHLILLRLPRLSQTLNWLPGGPTRGVSDSPNPPIGGLVLTRGENSLVLVIFC